MAVEFPDGFAWGVAGAAHQIEGGNVNNDWWAWEHDPDSPCPEPSGDACDSFHRYRDDIRLVRDLGIACYRWSLEWSRIEPAEGEFSIAALDHYRRVLATCHEFGVRPVVTFHHFTTPRWLADRGGWLAPDAPACFARFCERAVAHLGDLVDTACTINEPNVVAVAGYLFGRFPPGRQDFDEWARANAAFVDAHRRAADVLRAGPGSFPVGLTVAMGDWWAPPGHEELIARVRGTYEDTFLEAARGDDFVGVQAYSRTRLDEQGMPTGPEPGVEVLPMGYEYWPQSLEVAVRHAADVAGVPIVVTENGIGTDDDEQRIRYLTESLTGLRRCIDDGIDVRGFTCWSLLDNFEWAEGYRPKFGLVAVEPGTFARHPKASAAWFGALARTNRLPAGAHPPGGGPISRTSS